MTNPMHRPNPTHIPRPPEQPEVTGLSLRYAALLVMDGVREPTSVQAIALAIERLGVRVPDRKGKWVSDALRCEHRRGRILRVGRDQYVGTRLAERTRRRAARQILDLRRGAGRVAA